MSASQTPRHRRRQRRAGSDPSMEDILASIRRILSEDESAGAAAAAPRPRRPAQPAGEDVLVLDPADAGARTSEPEAAAPEPPAASPPR